MEHAVWCIHCHRVWDGAALAGAWPHLLCADPACNDGQPGTFMPYHQTRRLIARHWPALPAEGQTLPLKEEGAPSTPRGQEAEPPEEPPPA